MARMCFIECTIYPPLSQTHVGEYPENSVNFVLFVVHNSISRSNTSTSIHNTATADMDLKLCLNVNVSEKLFTNL